MPAKQFINISPFIFNGNLNGPGNLYIRFIVKQTIIT